MACPDDSAPSASTKRQPRIPVTLQAVMIMSQRGKDVVKPPPNGVAFKSFTRWFPGRNSSKKTSSVNDDTVPGASPDFITDSASCQDHLETRTTCSDDTYTSADTVGTQPKIRKKKKPFGRRSTRKSSSSDSPEKPLGLSAPKKNRHISPQAYLTSMLKTRGYNTTIHRALGSGYFQRPSPLDLASFGSYMEHMIESNNAEELKQALETGLSPNACEHPDGFSIVHRVCEKGFKESLQVLLLEEYEGRVDVVDSSGRTPLHMACLGLREDENREPCFEIIDLILKQHKRLFYLADDQGRLPLACLPEKHWTAWTRFLMSRKEEYWPERDVKTLGFEKEDPVAVQPPLSLCNENEKDVISLHLALQVAEGHVSPLEALIQRVSADVNDLDADFCSDDDDSMSDSDEDDSFDEDDDDDDEEWSESTFDQDELEEILGCIGSSRPVAWTSTKA